MWRWNEYPFLAFGIAAVLLSLALYGRLLQAPFVYDDFDQVVRNPSLLTWHAFASRFLQHPVALNAIFRGRGGLTYRPVFWLSLALDRHIWELNAAGFHLTNLALHVVNGFLLVPLLRKLRLPWMASSAAALLWLALPINVEVVAWISARSYSLATAFILCSLLCALRWFEAPRPWVLLLYAAFCLLALLSNEIGFLVLPLVALFCVERRSAWKPAAPLLGIASVAITLGWFVRRMLHVQQSSSGTSYRVIGAEFWKYLGWMIAPIHMSVERSTSVPTNMPAPGAIAAWIGMIALPVAALACRRRVPLLTLGLLWMTICLLPFCGFIYVYQGMAERFTYLASIGLAMAVAGAVSASPPSVRNGVLGAVALWIAWGAWRGVGRVGDWTDPSALYQHSLEANPDSAALSFNLGFTLKEAGDLPGAEHAFVRTAQLRPDYPKVHASLGDVYLAEGKLSDAQQEYAAELATDPNAYETLLNSAIAFQRAGASAEAEQQDRKAIAIAPAESGAYTNLGALYLQENRVDDAAEMFTKAIQARPSDPSPYFNLAVLYQQAHRPELARPLYEKVLRLKPGDPDTLANLAAMR